jgi:hypothetical protein
MDRQLPSGAALSMDRKRPDQHRVVRRLVALYADRTWKHSSIKAIFAPSDPVIGRP